MNGAQSPHVNDTAQDIFLRVAQAVSMPIDKHFHAALIRRIIAALTRTRAHPNPLLDTAPADDAPAQAIVAQEAAAESGPRLDSKFLSNSMAFFQPET